MKGESGKFIVLEGLDRSGKSSISRFLKDKLSNQSESPESSPKCILKSYPDRTTKIGAMINDFLTNKLDIGNEAIHLLFSANRWESDKTLRQTLKEGTSIVCDRYWYSGVAYSAAKGLSFDWTVQADQGLLEPDLIIFLKADAQTLSKRSGYGEERFERLDFQSKVAEQFETIFQHKAKEDPSFKDRLAVVDINGKDLQGVKKQVIEVLTEKSII